MNEIKDQPAEHVTEPPPEESLTHFTRERCVCGDPNTAYCGADISRERYLRPEEYADAEMCVVCVELLLCPGCGADIRSNRERH
ncbi:hypothetical protein AAIB33_10585 [Microbacterium sp. AZCO]|uniref:hypothetical protein n=1 Tax=Microbacterium sp. AZCO TaxID=3142976 RepID=UPI0031F40F6C